MVGISARRSNLRVMQFAIVCAIVTAFNLRLAQAAYEAPDAAWAAPTTYYNTATGTGFTLRSNLHTIISTLQTQTTPGFVGRSYGDSRYNMATQEANGTPKTSIDQDPNNPNNIMLVYNNASITGIWDAGATWNREHAWPKKWLNVTSAQVSNTYIGPASDSFELLPSNPGINSSRSDNGYGYYPNVSGSGGAYGNNTAAGVGTFWFPSASDSGEISRAIFYMATRYFNPANPTRGTDIQNLDLKNGTPTTYNFGDLNSLLHWNYEYGVDNYERRRNQLIYGSSGDLTDHALNPNHYQGNRNPYIDHPEYVWTVYGTHKIGNDVVNDSQLTVGNGTVTNGASTANVILGSVLVGSSLGTSSVAFNKTGADPTTFNMSAAGNVVVTTSAVGSFSHPVVGVGQGIDFGAQSGTVTVGLNASTSTAGLKSGALTVHNSDISLSAGAGQGSADGDDTINVSASVLDHSNGSFTGGSDTNSLTINFGRIGQSSGTHNAAFSLNNLEATAGFTAGLALNTITPGGSAPSLAAISTNLGTFANLAAGSHADYNAGVDTANLGSFTATYTLGVSDQVLPGATSNAPLTLTITAIVNPYAPGDFNLDHHVDAADIGPMMLALSNLGDYESQYGVSPTDLSYIEDVNGDGSLTNADLQFLENQLVNGGGATSSVPEPSTFVLLGLGSAFMLLRRRQVRR